MNVFELMAKISLDATDYNKGLDAIKNGAAKIGSLGAKALGAATAAVAAFGISSIRTGMNFDSAMSQVAATMGKTTDQMLNETGKVELSWGTFTGNLRDYAQEMGANTVFSATQAAEALNYMALAGYDTQKSMETLPAVMNLASAGAMDLASASDMVTDTETALGLESERTAKLINEMAKAASMSNTSVSQLGSAILTIGGTAKQLNGGMVELADGTEVAYDGTTELAAALGILADNGTKGSEAGTTLRNVLSSISGKKFEKSFGALGVSAYDSEGKLRSLKDILADMNEAMEGMTDQEKTNLINSTFNARDLKNVNALLATTDERWGKLVSGLDEAGEAGVMYAGKLYSMEEAQKKFGDSIYDTEKGFKVLGAAEMMAYQQMDNLDGDITLFKSALEGAQIALSDKITPSLREFVQIGSEGVGEFAQKLKDGDIPGAFESIGATVGTLATEIIKHVPDVVNAGAELLGGIAKGIVSAASQIDFKYAVVPMLIAFSANVREGASILISSGIDLVRNIGDGARQNASYLTNIAGILLDNFVGIFTDNAEQLFEFGLDIIKGISEGFAEGFPMLVEKAVELLSDFTSNLGDNLGTFLEVGIQVIQNIIQGIMDSLPTLIENVPQIIFNIAQAIIENLPTILAGAIQIIWTIRDGIVNAIPTLLKAIPQIFQAIFAVWTALDWGQVGQNAIDTIKGGIQAVINAIPDKIKEIGNKAIEWFKDINWTEAGQKAINKIVDAIQSLFNDIPNKIKSIANDAKDKFTSVDWWDVGSQVINGIANGIWDGAGKLIDAAKDAAKNAFEAAKDFLGIQSPSKLFREKVGRMISQGLAIGIDLDADKAVESAENMAKSIVKPFDGLDLGVNTPTLETTPIKPTEEQSQVVTMLGSILTFLQENMNNGEPIPIVLDGGLTVGYYDKALGVKANMRRRGVI